MVMDGTKPLTYTVVQSQCAGSGKRSVRYKINKIKPPERRREEKRKTLGNIEQSISRKGARAAVGSHVCWQGG